MYRIVNAQGQTVYRTDIFSRSQIGRGDINPVQRRTGLERLTPWTAP